MLAEEILSLPMEDNDIFPEAKTVRCYLCMILLSYWDCDDVIVGYGVPLYQALVAGGALRARLDADGVPLSDSKRRSADKLIAAAIESMGRGSRYEHCPSR